MLSFRSRDSPTLLKCWESLLLLLLPLATATVVTVGPVLVALVGQEIVKKVVEAQKWLEKINGTGALQRRRRFFERFRAIFRGLSLDFKALSYLTGLQSLVLGLLLFS